MKNRVDAAEDVLRRIAALPAPEGLEDRLQARLSASLQNAPRRSRRSLWLENLGNLFQYSAPLRAAAAVTLAVVVMGCGWLVARHTAAENSAHRQPAPLSAPASGGFSTAGAIRLPQTLQGPEIPAAQSGDAVQSGNQPCARKSVKIPGKQTKCKAPVAAQK